MPSWDVTICDENGEETGTVGGLTRVQKAALLTALTGLPVEAKAVQYDTHGKELEYQDTFAE